MTGYEFAKGPWHNLSWLTAETENFYAQHVTPKGLGDRFSVAEAKILKHRQWEYSMRLIKGSFDRILRELGIFYVPQQMDPGPCIVFPQRNYYQNLVYGQMRPLYRLDFGHGPAKYVNLGTKPAGPVWFGDSDQALLSIGRTRSVALVEGYFDLLACRLLMLEAPILSTGTKSFNRMHIDFLEMLGVRTVHLMFDNEPPKAGRAEGAGNAAMRYLGKAWEKKSTIRFECHLLPAGDPSACLQREVTALSLRSLLRSIFGERPPLEPFDD